MTALDDTKAELRRTLDMLRTVIEQRNAAFRREDDLRVKLQALCQHPERLDTFPAVCGVCLKRLD